MSSLCTVIFIVAILNIIKSDSDICGCNYWRSVGSGSGVAHGINQCEYELGTGSTFYECEFHDGQGQYRVKGTTYDSTDCTGIGTGVDYLDMLTHPDTDEYYCEASTDCIVAAIEEYSNSGYNSQQCIQDSTTLISRITRVTGCCLDNTFSTTPSSYEIQECSSNQIIESEWVVNGVNSKCSGEYKPYVIIGGYGSEGMVFTQFDPTTGSLSAVSGPTSTGGNDPETFQINYDKDIIYTASGGEIAAVPVDVSNSFIFGTISSYSVSPAGAPVWVATDKDYTFVYTASYGWESDYSSGFRVFKIDSSTGLLNPDTAIISVGFAPTATSEGTDGSHSHCILPNPTNPYHFYLADLARDVVEHYEIIDNQDGTYDAELRSSVSFADGSGPRTLAFNPVVDGILYVSQEYAYKVAVISFDTSSYELTQIEQDLSTLPDTAEWNSITPDVSHVDTDKLGKFLYVANRDNSRTNLAANNMAVFELSATTGLIVTDSLFINDCGGNIPRQFKIDPSNKYMFIANQFGDGEGGWPGSMGQLAIYERNLNNGSLTEVDIVTYSDLGYSGLAMSWVDFYYVTASATTEISTPSDISNPCYDGNTLTDTYTMVTCDYTPPTDEPTFVPTTEPTDATPSPTDSTSLPTMAPSEGIVIMSSTNNPSTAPTNEPTNEPTKDNISMGTTSTTNIDDELSSTIITQQTIPSTDDGEPTGNGAITFTPIFLLYSIFIIAVLCSK